MKPLHNLLLASFILALIHPSVQQINVNVEIDTVNGSSTLTSNLSPELQQANLTQGYVQSITNTELIVEICPTGTFSNNAQCVNCPAGTASPVQGASNDMTCAACNAGTFAAAKSSACTNCQANTFSATYKASSSAQCLSCPQSTTSIAGSDNVRSCVCNNGLFVSNNLVPAFDGVSLSLGFEGAAGVNLAHVVC
jgi:hypothetical protein